MTRAFLEPVVLVPKNESFIRDAFSKEAKKNFKDYEKQAKKTIRRTTNKNKLSIKDLF